MLHNRIREEDYTSVGTNRFSRSCNCTLPNPYPTPLSASEPCCNAKPRFANPAMVRGRAAILLRVEGGC
jgi:hypothetical protein